MDASIKTKKEIAENTLRVDFDLNGQEIEFKPGDHFIVDLIDPPYEDDRGSRRHFSLINFPDERQTVSMATRVSDSAFKRSLAEMPTGSKAEISNIGGNFTLPEDSSVPLVFIAGGIGITPFICMSRHIAKKGLDYQVKLLYSNRDRKSSAFIDELEDYQLTVNNFDLVLTLTGDPDWPGESGRIDSDFISRHITDPDKHIFMIAGPPVMVDSVSKELEKLGIEKDKIAASNFSGY